MPEGLETVAVVAAVVNLLALVAQTGALFFWGGRLSERQKFHGEQIRDIGGRVRALEGREA